MVSSVLFIGVMSMIVWAYHMFLTGMGTRLGTFFQITTMIISIPSVVLVTSLMLSLCTAGLPRRPPSVRQRRRSTPKDLPAQLALKRGGPSAERPSGAAGYPAKLAFREADLQRSWPSGEAGLP